MKLIKALQESNRFYSPSRNFFNLSIMYSGECPRPCQADEVNPPWHFPPKGSQGGNFARPQQPNEEYQVVPLPSLPNLTIEYTRRLDSKGLAY